jgi:hypothetical protein
MASFENLVGRLEDLLSGTFGDLLGAQPMLDVPSTEFSSGEVQAFAADQRHAFSFHFAEADWRLFIIVHAVHLIAVTENDMP